MRRLAATLLLAVASAASAAPARFLAVTDGGLAILDGDRLEAARSVSLESAVATPPVVSADGRVAWVASADRLHRLRLDTLAVTTSVALGDNPHALALSGDGRYLAAAVREPPALLVLDASGLAPLAKLPAADALGRPSPVSAVATAADRGSFVAVLPEVRELWEVPYRPDAAALPVYRGILHDWRRESGEPPPIDASPFPIRRIAMTQPAEGLLVGPGSQELVTVGADGLEVINLIVGRPIARLPVAGAPSLAEAARFRHDEVPFAALANPRHAALLLLDLARWRVAASLPTGGPTMRVRTAPQAAGLWVVSRVAGEDRLLLIDKGSHAIEHTLRPFPGRTIAALAVSPDGRHVFAAAGGSGGGLVRYAAADPSRPARTAHLRIQRLIALPSPARASRN